MSSVADRYISNERIFDLEVEVISRAMCSWCQKNKATTKYMQVDLCEDCKFNKLNNESSGEKYDRYISYGCSHEEAYGDSYGGEGQ